MLKIASLTLAPVGRVPAPRGARNRRPRSSPPVNRMGRVPTAHAGGSQTGAGTRPAWLDYSRQMARLTPAVEQLIALALEEDLGRGDVTSAAVLDAGARAEADIAARGPLVVAGLEVAAAVFRRVDAGLTVTARMIDGEAAAAGAVLASVAGPAAALLAAERTA